MALNTSSEEELIKINKKMRMKKIFLWGKKKYGPEWMQRIAHFLLTIEKVDKSDEYMKALLELFLEYRIEGMESNAAFKKAKLVLDCFGI